MYYIICIRSAFAGFSWVFGAAAIFVCAFAGFCLLFLGFWASAAIFVCAFVGFCWLFLGFWRFGEAIGRLHVEAS